jgi:hypothetical protein
MGGLELCNGLVDTRPDGFGRVACHLPCGKPSGKIRVESLGLLIWPVPLSSA